MGHVHSTAALEHAHAVQVQLPKHSFLAPVLYVSYRPACAATHAVDRMQSNADKSMEQIKAQRKQ